MSPGLKRVVGALVVLICYQVSLFVPILILQAVMGRQWTEKYNRECYLYMIGMTVVWVLFWNRAVRFIGQLLPEKNSTASLSE